jgi:hypothetical protein
MHAWDPTLADVSRFLGRTYTQGVFEHSDRFDREVYEPETVKIMWREDRDEVAASKRES